MNMSGRAGRTKGALTLKTLRPELWKAQLLTFRTGGADCEELC